MGLSERYGVTERKFTLDEWRSLRKYTALALKSAGDLRKVNTLLNSAEALLGAGVIDIEAAIADGALTRTYEEV